MEPGRRDRISDLHDRALACPPEQRRDFLEQACGGDRALLEEVESLLRHESEAVHFLEAPAAVMAGDLARTPGRSAIAGCNLGPYTLVALLGAGGMGEVYRARDSKLGRDVAIKLLPAHFTADPERRARFAREARLLATLNHPHIGAIYGLEEIAGVTALILELVEGPTLADRLARGPLPIAEALAIARQLAAALDAAHGKGIVHRDLKPANVVLQGAAGAPGLSSSDPRARVLDFGLAKTIDVGLDLTEPPSASFGRTADGRILGTPAYMSPEQARGQAVDKRTDIWAFGCVLYEMLAGRAAFGGDTMSDAFVSILEREPDWTALPVPGTPAPIRALLERCLRKDARRRLHDIADALIELEDIQQSSAAVPAPAAVVPEAPRGRGRLGWMVSAGLALTLAGTMLLNLRPAPSTDPERVELALLPPEGSRFTRASVELAVSPDGRHVAFVATSKAGSSLWVRSLAAINPRPLPGTEGARNPFWSPDSQSIGFFADNQVRAVPVSGGAPVVHFPWSGSFPVAEERGGFAPGGSWGRKDVIVFGPSSDGQLYQVDVNGGTPGPVTTGKPAGEYRWPSFLPDGQHFLYSYFTGRSYELRLGSLLTADTVAIATLESVATYAGEHLFFLHGGNLMAQSFDQKTLRPTGEPVRLGVQVKRGMLGVPGFSVSDNGRLVFLAPPDADPQLTWLDRSGNTLGVVGDPGFLGNLDLSPDGQQLAVTRLTTRPAGAVQSDIWLVDVATGRAAPLTDDPAGDYDPAWSPDGKHVVFNSNRSGRTGLFMRASDGSGFDVPILKSDTDNFTVASWSPANVLVFNLFNHARNSDLWTLSLSGERRPEPFVSSKHSELNGTFSPDGRWIAYQSDAPGRYEILVRPFPAREPAQTISRDGGMLPRWRGDGREIFFVSSDGMMMAAGFDAAIGAPKGVPQRLFPTRFQLGINRPYAVDRRGERFLIPSTPDPRVITVMDWRALVTR